MMKFREACVGLGVLLCSIGFAQSDLDDIQIPFFAPKKWALCIGTQNYTSITPLKYAASDATDFAASLKSSLGFSDQSITLLSDKGGTPATSANVNAALDRMLTDRAMDRGDLVIVYFSGHGVGLSDGDYWLPNDTDPSNPKAKAIRIESVVKKLVAKKLRNVVIISDACRAGAKNSFGSSLISLGRKANIAVLLGCAPGAKSYEDPRSKHGFFTNYLMKNLGSLDTVDPKTGALKVSTLGQKVATTVEAATKADFGANAQKPLVAVDKDQEVILGTVIRSNRESRETVAAIRKELASGKLTAQAAHQVLFNTALALEESGDDEAALDIYRQLRALDFQSRQFDLHHLLVLLRKNRTTEANRIFERMFDQPEASLWVDLMSVFAPSNLVSTGRLANAAQSLFNSEYRDSVLGSLDSEMRDRGMTAEREALHRRMQTLSKTSWPDFADIARISRTASAEQIARSVAGFKPNPDPHSLQDLAARNAYSGYIRTRDFDRAAALADSMISKDPGHRYWNMKRLVLATLRLEPDLKERVKKQLHTCERGRFALDCQLLIGSDAADLAEEFSKVADRLPNSFEAQVAAWVSHSMLHPEKVQKLPERLLKLAPSDAEQFSVPFLALSDALQRTVASPRFTPGTLQKLNFHLGNDLSDAWSEYGEESPHLLADIYRLFNRSDESWRVRVSYLNLDGDLLDAMPKADQIRIYEEATLALINNGDLSAAENALSRLNEMDGSASELSLRFGVAQMLNGYIQGAKNALAQITANSLSGTEKTLAHLLEIHLAIVEKDWKQVSAMTDKLDTSFQFDDGLLMYMHYLGQLRNPDKILTNETAKDVLNGNAKYHDIYSAILRLAAERMATLKTDDVVRETVMGKIVSDPQNLWFENTPYPLLGDIKSFEGVYEAKGLFVSPGGSTDGKLQLIIATDGIVTGKLSFTDEPTIFALNGEIDRNGVITGTAKLSDAKTGSFSVRLLPRTIWETLPEDRMPLHKLVFGAAHPSAVMFVFEERNKPAKVANSKT